MLTIDCKDVLSIRNELLVYVSDQVAAIPTLKHNQFTLSAFDEDADIDISTVVTAIREFLDSIGEGRNFTVLPSEGIIHIKSVYGKTIDHKTAPPQEMFSCTHWRVHYTIPDRTEHPYENPLLLNRLACITSCN